MNVNRELSQRLGEAVDTMIRHCWRNAFVALCEPEAAGGLYVEGWVRVDGLLVEHGWIELGGAIVDPTYYGPRDNQPQEVIYFPALRFDLETARREMMRKGATQKAGDLPIAWRYGWGGYDNPAYLAAYEAALAWQPQEQDTPTPARTCAKCGRPVAAFDTLAEVGEDGRVTCGPCVAGVDAGGWSIYPGGAEGGDGA